MYAYMFWAVFLFTVFFHQFRNCTWVQVSTRPAMLGGRETVFCAANWTLVSLNTFCHSMPVRESHYAYTIFTLLHTPILPLLDTPLSQFKGSACNREERTGSPRTPRIDLHYDAEIQYWMHFNKRGTFSVPSSSRYLYRILAT